MPQSWTLTCYGCASSGNPWPAVLNAPTVAYWTYPVFCGVQRTMGLCRRCLDTWLDNADEGMTEEPVMLQFLVSPAELMAAA